MYTPPHGSLLELQSIIHCKWHRTWIWATPQPSHICVCQWGGGLEASEAVNNGHKNQQTRYIRHCPPKILTTFSIYEYSKDFKRPPNHFPCQCNEDFHIRRKNLISLQRFKKKVCENPLNRTYTSQSMLNLHYLLVVGILNVNWNQEKYQKIWLGKAIGLNNAIIFNNTRKEIRMQCLTVVLGPPANWNNVRMKMRWEWRLMITRRFYRVVKFELNKIRTQNNCIIERVPCDMIYRVFYLINLSLILPIYKQFTVTVPNFD